MPVPTPGSSAGGGTSGRAGHAARGRCPPARSPGTPVAHPAAAACSRPCPAAPATGVAASDIRRFAGWLAQADPLVIAPGNGLERGRNGGSGVRAIIALPRCGVLHYVVMKQISLMLPQREATILETIIQPGGELLPKPVARYLLSLKFRPEDTARINALSARSQLTFVRSAKSQGSGCGPVRLARRRSRRG